MTSTKSVMLDIIKHTSGLNLIENLKITGTEDLTKLRAIDPDHTIVLSAVLHKPVLEFAGEFGMSNLGLISSLLNLSTYASETASLTIKRETRSGEEVPTTLVFEDGFGNKDEYRFMSKSIIDKRLGNEAKMVDLSWDIDIAPGAVKVADLSDIASIYTSIDPNFQAKVENNDLIFEIGSFDTGVNGRRIFASNVGGNLKNVCSWKLGPILGVLKLGMQGMCNLRISDRGLIEITIDSGIGIYTYLFPALTQ